MKKRILCALLAAVMLLGIAGIGIGARAAEGEVTLRLHYHREDGNYDGWDVWFWIDQGSAYPFAEENGEMIATFTFQPGATQVGYIVRKGDWEAKDIGEDQFIDVTGVLAGTLEVYVESGVKGHTVVKGEDVVCGVAVVSAAYNGELTVTVKTSAEPEGELTAGTFAITDGEAYAEIENAEKTGECVYTLTLAAPLDMAKSYRIVLQEKEYDLDMPDYYAMPAFEEKYTYAGNDLGATYTAEKTTLRVWAPTASAVCVNLYTNGDPAVEPESAERVDMTPAENGTWVAELPGDRNGTYYTYSVTLASGVKEACDPYARTTGVNGARAMILDLAATNPAGWDGDKDPNAGKSITDAVIYELHVRDLSMDDSSGIENKGKYLGLIETGTKNADGIATGLDHIKELGVTHLHILPAYDYGSVDESKLDKPQFNWGYDPVNYNVPEGSYSTNPYDGAVRVREFKQMVRGLHENGVSVVMDVVYNHVHNANTFCFNQIVPGYFSRPNSNGSGCGNDTASERAMVRKYIVDSVRYWADEYHVDGFRFDLVGLLDTETVNAIVEEVHKTHPNVIFYGEGWTMNTNVTKPGLKMATQTNSSETPAFAYFSDTMRDMLKGSVFDQATGFVSGATGKEATLRQCYMARPAWCKNPTQIINYASCHDNNTLIDRITLSTPDASRADQIRMNNLAAAAYLTAQGVPFMQAGEEMLRSKPLGDGFDSNSYASPDAVNALKWDDLSKAEYQAVFAYYKGLIALRKAHPSLRLTTEEAVTDAVKPIAGLEKNVVAFCILGDDSEGALYAIFNANNAETTVTLPEGSWDVCVNAEKAGVETLNTVSGTVKVAPISAMILTCKDKPGEIPSGSAPTEPVQTTEPTEPVGQAKQPLNPALLAGIGIALGVAAAVGILVFVKKKKK